VGQEPAMAGRANVAIAIAAINLPVFNILSPCQTRVAAASSRRWRPRHASSCPRHPERT
jgi:hypothetical protein